MQDDEDVESSLSGRTQAASQILEGGGSLRSLLYSWIELQLAAAPGTLRANPLLVRDLYDIGLVLVAANLRLCPRRSGIQKQSPDAVDIDRHQNAHRVGIAT